MNKWLGKNTKKVFQPNTLFSFAAASYVNHFEFQDNFAKKLISNHKSEHYEVVYSVCWRCIDNNLNHCTENHKKSQNSTITSGSYLPYVERDYCWPAPIFSYVDRPISCKRKLEF